MSDFPGVALITGAASGIGKATATLFARDGCKRIVVADVNVGLLEATRKEIQTLYPNSRILATQLDVKSQESVAAMVGAAIKEFGRIDYCANVAGIIKYGDTSIMSVEDFDLVQQINLRGVFLCAKAQISAMLNQEPLTSRNSSYPARGAIINVASQAGLMGNGDIPAYVSSKHGVVGLSKSDGLKFGPMGIRVNAVCPGSVETPILDMRPERVAARAQEIALGRTGKPEEIAECILFLASHKSSFVTATTLAPNGGMKL